MAPGPASFSSSLLALAREWCWKNASELRIGLGSLLAILRGIPPWECERPTGMVLFVDVAGGRVGVGAYVLWDCPIVGLGDVGEGT